jgi:hypothetical protein
VKSEGQKSLGGLTEGLRTAYDASLRRGVAHAETCSAVTTMRSRRRWSDWTVPSPTGCDGSTAAPGVRWPGAEVRGGTESAFETAQVSWMQLSQSAEPGCCLYPKQKALIPSITALGLPMYNRSPREAVLQRSPGPHDGEANPSGDDQVSAPRSGPQPGLETSV